VIVSRDSADVVADELKEALTGEDVGVIVDRRRGERRRGRGAAATERRRIDRRRRPSQDAGAEPSPTPPAVTTAD
jgi:hypothetical protein